MLGALRIIFFASLLVIGITDSWSQHSSQQIGGPKASPDHSQTTKSVQEDAQDSPAIKKAMPSQETNPPTDKHNNGGGIGFEGRIANYTWWLTFCTGALVFVTAGLVYLGWRQEGHFKRAERAYIAVEPQGVIPFAAVGNSIIHVSIKNVGTIPARNVSWRVLGEACGNGRREDFPIDEAKMSGNNVVPKGTVMNYNQTAILDEQSFTNIRGHGCFYYVWGMVRYNDGFGVKRFTRFCHRYNGTAYVHIREGAHNGEWGILPDGAKYHQWGNDAD